MLQHSKLAFHKNIATRRIFCFFAYKPCYKTKKTMNLRYFLQRNLRLHTFSISLLALGCCTAAQAANMTWPGHVTLGTTWLNQILPANNRYGSPPHIGYDQANVLHATAECGSYTAQLILQAYENTITPAVLQALTGSISPTAEQWHDAIDPSQNHPNNPSAGISLVALDHTLNISTGRTLRHEGIGLLAVGDILAAKYSNGNANGHVMTIQSVTPPTANQMIVLSGTRVIPGVSHVKRWIVNVLDATASVHGSSDSRYQQDSDEEDGHDHGIGRGIIYLYEDATQGSGTLGQLLGWTWSSNSAYTYQFTAPEALDNKGKSTYRPMQIGRFIGAGL